MAPFARFRLSLVEQRTNYHSDSLKSDQVCNVRCQARDLLQRTGSGSLGDLSSRSNQFEEQPLVINDGRLWRDFMHRQSSIDLFPFV